MKLLLLLLSLFIGLLNLASDSTPVSPKTKTPPPLTPPFLQYEHCQWVDSVIQHLTVEQKIAQLIMMPLYPKRDSNELKKAIAWVKQQYIGGIISFQGGPVKTAQWLKRLQYESDLPLLTAIDGEWGLAMRLDSTVSFPKQMMLGAIRNDSLIFKMGKEIGKECRAIGINIDFAPDIDINTNPKNLIIGYRSFGENKQSVARKGMAYTNGLQSQQVMAVAKHFPGHGDTESDSHKTLPIVKHDSSRIFRTELFPFRQLFAGGVGGVMVAHLFIPAFETEKNVASTLSPKIVTGILKKQMKFKGLVFTDAMNMKGVSAYWPTKQLIEKAVLAGNDILLMPKDVKTTISIVKQLIAEKRWTEEDLDKRVRKILAAKYWLRFQQPISTKNLSARLNNANAFSLNELLRQKAITLLLNSNHILPLTVADTKKIGFLTLGKTYRNAKTINEYAVKYKMGLSQFGTFTTFNAEKTKQTFKNQDVIVVSLHAPGRRPKHHYGIPDMVFKQLTILAKQKKVVLQIFGSPYLLNNFENLGVFSAVVIAYDNDKLTQKTAAELLFGVYGYEGRLPVSVRGFLAGSGKTTKAVGGLGYSKPETVGMNSKILSSIDSIALAGIKANAYPGCQILVAKNGKIVYDKAFGYFTYDKKQAVKTYNLYDLASLTKVLATTLAVMKLYDEGKLKLTDKLSTYLPWLDTTNKKNITIIDVMTHQARLKPWIPFYLKAVNNKTLYDSLFHKQWSAQYPLKVANQMFMNKDYVHEIYRRIGNSPLNRKKEYKYSDLGFYLLKNIVEKLTNQPFDRYVEQTFYRPLGANRLCFNPLQYFPKKMIAPTENDSYFRHQQVQGYVHDFGAAMLGGVGGHAGLFSNAEDIAKVLQMLLNGGTMYGQHFLKSSTIAYFTSAPFLPDNRRGIGFDKPEKDENIGPTCNEAPEDSYGHSGFTGTIFWVDPKQQLIYIFLSNRVYPIMENNKLVRMNIRTKIQEVIYKSMESNKTASSK